MSGAYDFAAHAAYKLANPARPVGWQLMRETADAASVASGRVSEEAEQVSLVRDIFGNPFRPMSFSLELRTSAVVALGRQMYDNRDFTAMPILADALEDAGCASADILDHCRQPGEHVRGCWVVDLVLAKE